jgi:hypothetical protein
MYEHVILEGFCNREDSKMIKLDLNPSKHGQCNKYNIHHDIWEMVSM